MYVFDVSVRERLSVMGRERVIQKSEGYTVCERERDVQGRGDRNPLEGATGGFTDPPFRSGSLSENRSSTSAQIPQHTIRSKGRRWMEKRTSWPGTSLKRSKSKDDKISGDYGCRPRVRVRYHLIQV